MNSPVRGVRGDLLQWARIAQDLTMRTVRERGGPCLGYQSEVEHGKKSEVRYELLTGWVRALGVTPAFARGEVPVYNQNPASCLGLGADILPRLFEQPDRWADMSAEDRSRTVLCLVADYSRQLPRTVLAHVLQVEPATLDGIMLGDHPLMGEHVRALADLTSLPLRFFWHGELPQTEEREYADAEDAESEQPYAQAIAIARRAGVTPDELASLLRQTLPALHSKQRAGA